MTGAVEFHTDQLAAALSAVQADDRWRDASPIEQAEILLDELRRITS